MSQVRVSHEQGIRRSKNQEEAGERLYRVWLKMDEDSPDELF
jgi:hypothetical protein